MSSALIPLCFGASGSVRTKVRMTSASCAPEVHTFCPLTTKWSPSRTARVVKPSQVRARARFTHAQRRGHLGAQDRHRPPLLLLLGAERQQRRGDDADALRVERVIDAPPRRVLRDGRTVRGCPRCGRRTPAGCPAAASRGRTAAAASGAPTPARATSTGTARRPLRPRRQVLVEERDELRAERLDLGVERELHTANISST